MSDVLDRARSLLSFSGDLEQQLSHGDPAGVSGLVTRFHELRHELGRIDPNRLRDARGEIGSVIDTLGQVADEIDRLLTIKRVGIPTRAAPPQTLGAAR